MDIALIAKRREEIESTLSELDARATPLREELGELEIAERVLARLSMNQPAALTRQTAQASTTKPDGTPTVTEMILEAYDVAEAGSSYPAHLGSKEYCKFIGAKYWPGVKSDNISSTIWRMHKNGMIVRQGDGKYTRPKKKETPDDVNRAGEPSEASGLFTPAKGREAVPGGGP